ncbi:MAG TPA: nuclear transport factor 2 family protein [Solirubrobacterales bacterium]
MKEESELLKAFREAFEEGNRAWNAGDVKRAYAVLPDELEYRLSPTWPEARVLQSRDEVVAFFEDFQRTFPDAQTASHEFIEGSEGTVIVGFRVIGSGRSSGAGTEMQIWQVWQVSDELVPLGVTEFTNREDALNTAGVMESSARGAE